jgi:hypothetical protein|tara:strand:+ start:102 stop:404 length:303 start_codon:yes stop_codon:yes gene_type:complete
MVKDVSKIVKGFQWDRVSWKDREYLIGMVNDTINSKSVRASGIPFSTKYQDANEFALFNDESSKNEYKDEFYNADETASHLLTPHPKGRKYWLVWAYNKS